ncbi:MAG: glycosyltransferase family 39 protein [Chloroflexi bacterium]|nr:glycosyltransferase family 39 protein [Chloroflexota bacterium]
MVGVLARPGAAPAALGNRVLWPRWAPVAGVLLLAFGVRAIRPDFVPLNSDEAYFVQIAHDGTFLQAMHTTEAHPPLYLALLQGWMLAGGVTEYAIRYLSLLLGVAVVAAVYVLGRLLLDRALALAAAFAAAVNPYQVIYSHTARDYQLACLFGVVSLILLLRARCRPGLLPGFVIAALAALYSHYYGLAIVGFEAVLVLVWELRRKVRWQPWLMAFGLIGLGYLPWLVFASQVISGYDLGHGSLALVRDTLATTFEWYTIGQAHPAGALLVPGILTGVVLLAGVVSLARRNFGALVVASGLQLAPIVFGIASFVHTGQFAPRLVYLGSPGYLLLLGAGITSLAALPWLQLLPAGLLGVLGGMAVRNTAFTNTYATEGYRQLAVYLANHVQPTDAIVLDGQSQTPQYWYYGQLREGIRNQVAIMPRDATGNGAIHGTVDVPQTQRALETLAAQTGGMWFVDDDALTYDPLLDTERLLAVNWFEASTQKFVYYRLEYFSTRPSGPATPRSDPAGGMQLVQAALPSGPVAAGQALDVALVWRASRDGPPAFKQSLRLLDGAGQIVAQQDTAPQGGFVDMGAWRAGADLPTKLGLIVPVGTLPGMYKVQLVSYDAASGQALGSAIELGSVTVDHSAPQQVEASDLPPLATQGLVAGRIESRSVAAGARLGLTLLWSGGPTAQPQIAHIEIAGQTVEHEIGGDAYPSTRWQADDVVRDTFTVRVPSTAKPGTYLVRVSGVSVGQVAVTASQATFTPPQPQHPLQATFGQLTELLGYDPAGGQVRLYWHVLNETDTSYSVFLHATSPSGAIVAQVDQALGTADWVKGSYVSAAYALNAPLGSRISVGVYEPASGKRLALAEGGDELTLFSQ